MRIGGPSFLTAKKELSISFSNLLITAKFHWQDS